MTFTREIQVEITYHELQEEIQKLMLGRSRNATKKKSIFHVLFVFLGCMWKEAVSVFSLKSGNDKTFQGCITLIYYKKQT